MKKKDRLLTINRICDDFESKLRVGAEVNTDEVLQGAIADFNELPIAELLPELIELQIVYSNDRRITADALKSKYPEYKTRIESALQQASLEDEPWDAHEDGRAADEFLRPEIQRSLAEIGDRFIDLEHFASGGLGNVYVGFDKAVSRRVAVKLLKPELISDPRAKSRFLNEGAITGMLEHPGIVPIYDSGVTDDGQPYYAMRLLGGETLKEAVSRLHGKGTDDFEDRQRSLLRRLAQVCDAISFAHNCDIIHRDPSEGAKSSGDSMVEKTKNFCKEFIDPDQIDQQAKIPDAVIKGLAKIGVLGMTINKDHGGAGMTQYNYCRVMEIIGAHCASTAVFVNAHHSIGMRALELFGTDEQKERWLKPLTTGDKIAGFALTEAAAGSDASNVRTEAKLNDNGDYILNGEKRWITNGGIGDVLTVMARTPDPSEPDGKITACLLYTSPSPRD